MQRKRFDLVDRLERIPIPVHLKVVGDVHCLALHYLDILVIGRGKSAMPAFHLCHVIVNLSPLAALGALCLEHMLL